MLDKKIIAKECRFVHYSKSNQTNDDIHLIKENVHYDDGTMSPEVRIVKNYKRDFYITKKALRNHKELKEWEDIDKLDKFTCTETNLLNSIARALEMPYFKGSLRDLSKRAPYIYGADVTASSIIKNKYKKKWDTITPYSLAVFDVETDMIHGHKEIMISTVSMKNKVFTAIQKQFVAGNINVLSRVKELGNKYIGKILKDRNIDVEIVILDTEIDVVKATINKLHEWKPDFVAIWNITFDIGKVIDACNKTNTDIGDLLSDPIVPKEYRNFYFKKGIVKKEMASGRPMSFKPSQQWHTVKCPSSFYLIDAMCAYRQVRTGEPEEKEYNLDYILKLNNLGGKLDFPQADHITDEADWHKYMQEKYPLEYIVYNHWDCISIEMLDEKNVDLSISLPMLAESCDFEYFNSIPKKAINSLHYFIADYNKISGTTSSDMISVMDKEDVIDVSGIIVALDSHTVCDNGLHIVKENPYLATNVRLYTADLDGEGAYPVSTVISNVSRETTTKELSSVEGITDYEKLMNTINFSGGRTNSLEFATIMLNLPKLEDLSRLYDQQFNELIY